MGVTPIKLLIVEDNVGDTRLLREMLHEDDAQRFELAHAERLDDALESIGAARFDAILSDLSLPDARGLGTIEQLHERAPNTPIIVLTGTDNANMGLAALQAGAQDYLVKGQIDAALLARTIRYAMERQRMSLDLEQVTAHQLEMKDQFLSHVSHELRSPLTTVYQFVTILLDGLAGDMLPEQREYLEIALRNVNQLRTMIRDLLDVTRATTGKLIVERRGTSLVELIMETVRSKQASADSRGVTVTVSDLGYVPLVDADPDRVRQILSNLINNALKFTAEGGCVDVRATVDADAPDFLHVCITDTGCGISEQGLVRIFEHLYQEDNSTESSRKGLGIGLFICRELTARHGGQIWAESVLGAGSKFHFTLPRYPLAHLLRTLVTGDELLPGGLTLLAIELSARDPRPDSRLGESIRHKAWSCLAQSAVDGRDLLLPRLPSMRWGELMFMVTRSPDTEGCELAACIHAHIRQCEEIRDSDIDLRVTAIEIPAGPRGSQGAGQQQAQLLVERTEEAITAICCGNIGFIEGRNSSSSEPKRQSGRQ